MSMGLSFNLKFNSELHTRLLQFIKDRYNLSRQDMDKIERRIKRAEELFCAYLPEKETDAKRRIERENKGKPQFTTLVLPYSYAQLLSAHTYWTSVLLSRSPIFQYAVRHGGTTGNSESVEALIDYQVHVGKMLVPLYVWLLDIGKFGMGVLGAYWDREEVTTSYLEEVEEKFLGILPTGKKMKKKVTQIITGYMGNKLYNIHPRHWYPDTRLPLNRFQEGEFCGRYVEIPWNRVRERVAKGSYFNLEELKNHADQVRTTTVAYAQREEPNTHIWRFLGNDPSFVPAIEMVIELAPREWGLGSGDRLEKWVFTCTEDMTVIFGAQPLGCYHNQFPYVLGQMEPEGYALFARGFMEILEPLQNGLDWLFNSHIYNVRKVLNNQVILDPSRVVMHDVLSPEAGGVWRLAPTAYGTDPKTVYSQLQLGDVTRSHLQDMQVLMDFMQRASGVTDNLMGLVNTGGRKTATEVRSSNSFGANRLKTQTEFMSAMGFEPLSQMLLQNSQQYLTSALELRIAGDAMMGESVINVGPEQIAGFYDFVPVDGTLPIDRYAMANLWREMLMQMGQVPVLAQGFDLPKIFQWVARLAGLKEIQKFKIQLAPEQQLMLQAQQGNVIPLNSKTAGELEGPSEPGQVMGMGATG